MLFADTYEQRMPGLGVLYQSRVNLHASHVQHSALFPVHADSVSEDMGLCCGHGGSKTQGCASDRRQDRSELVIYVKFRCCTTGVPVTVMVSRVSELP